MGFLGLYFSVLPMYAWDRLKITKKVDQSASVTHVRMGQTITSVTRLRNSEFYPCTHGTDCHHQSNYFLAQVLPIRTWDRLL